ncbi:hypothetical protein K7887_21340 [Sutcliffiella horikoshii]|uniref:hypothetical protein n=1 Tax=Sutcliffiella horikoshii TaxID=79883 RepID=UPI001CBF74E0|nr:hypothetical protein [Sutcliffiella horikoshii]UAL47357.1 hypothetical protein K7887_21340 [Sutcliffiella horikoshii]
MDVKEKVKELVRQAVEAYMSEQDNEEKKPAITVLLNYHSSNPGLILKAVTEIKESFAVKLVASKDWVELLEGDEDVLPLSQADHSELEKLWNSTDLLILPVASFQLVSKLALMVNDDRTAHTAIQFQLLGKPIVIANNEVELGVYQQILAPHSVQEKLQAYLRTTQKDQVKWVPLKQLLRTAKEQHQQYKEKQPLIMAKHIEHAARENVKTITVPKESKITPVAKDIAREMKIQIQKET